MSAGSGKVALLVLGVGRSGTSALTRVLNLLGAVLPPGTLAGDAGNERGHWETLSVLALSEEILALHGSDWYDPRPFPAGWFAGSEAAVFIARARAIIAAEYQGAPVILLKEPRICRLAPIYLAALVGAGYAPRVVIPLRHPSEVVASLQRRDGTDGVISELIWIRHLLEAEAATRDCPRVWTTYDQLLDDWRSVQARIASGLGVAWPSSAAVVAAQIDGFLAPQLRHFDAGREPAARSAGPIAAELWQVAQAGLTGDEAALRQGFDGVRAIIAAVDAVDAMRDAATPELQARRAQAQAVLAAAHARRLEAELAGQCGRIAELQASVSWRVTRPLRFVTDLLRRRP